jgi:penicillin-binding protein-related factor A (putative recombinase)
MNEGKIFEQNFRKSIPDDVYYQKLHDSSIGFDIENSTQRFALKSPYDYILYYRGNMYCLELKSTKNKSISYAGSNPMIKEHQIKELIRAKEKGCIAGFIINFRDTGNTYYLCVEFLNILHKYNGKSSFNEKDIKQFSIGIPARKLKVNYRYDLNPMLGR